MGADPIRLATDIADPLAFLTGARVPLVDPASSDRWEWVGDGAIYLDPLPGVHAHNLGFDAHWHGARPSSLAKLALAPSNEAVAALCDRRIAEATIGGVEDLKRSTVAGARLHTDRTGYVFRLAIIMSNGRTVVVGFGNELAEVLRDIPTDRDHIPHARATLVRALFGRAHA